MPHLLHSDVRSDPYGGQRGVMRCIRRPGRQLTRAPPRRPSHMKNDAVPFHSCSPLVIRRTYTYDTGIISDFLRHYISPWKWDVCRELTLANVVARDGHGEPSAWKSTNTVATLADSQYRNTCLNCSVGDVSVVLVSARAEYLSGANTQLQSCSGGAAAAGSATARRGGQPFRIVCTVDCLVTGAEVR